MIAPPRVKRESARRLSECVTAMIDKQPFFANLALHLPIVLDETRKTLATDGEQIRFNPEWIAETPAHEIEAAIARIVFACSLKHHTRRGERDPAMWQEASQLVTHPMIADAGFTLPADAAPKGPAAFMPEDFFSSKSAEEVYDWLKAQESDGGEDGEDEQDGDGGAGEGSAGGAQGESDGGQPGEDGDSGDGDGGESEGDQGDPGEGDGQDGEGEGPPSHDPSGTGEVMDSSARASGEPDQTEEEQKWDEVMHQSAQIAKAEGKLPGSMKDLVESVHASQMDWRAILKRFMDDVSKADYTWSAPNRRFIDSGLYLPSVHSEGMGPVVLLLDISESVVWAGDMLNRMWAEMREIAMEVQPESIHVVQVDTRVTTVEVFTHDDMPEELEVRGGGGTDFRPGFAWVEDEGMSPACLLYFTDMECSSFPEEPQYPVLWCDYGQGSYKRPAPFGETIELD